MRLSHSLTSVLVVLATVGVTSEAKAQPKEARVGDAPNGSGADTHLFRSALDSKGFYSVNGADIIGHNDVSFGLVLDYGYGLVPLSAGHGAEFMIKHNFQGTVMFDYGLLNWVVLGISLPVTLSQSELVTGVGPTGNLYDIKSEFTQGLEYVALHAKFRILRPGVGSGVSLAATLQGGVSAIGADQLTAEPNGFIWPQLIFEGRVGKGGIWRIGLNAGFRAHFGDPTVFGTGADGNPQLEHGSFAYDNHVTAGLGTSVRVLPPLDLVAETYGTYMVGGDSDTEQRPSAEVIGGFKLFIDGRSYLMLAGGAGYAPGFQTATARGTVGFMYEPSIGDKDGDGIKDDEDDCPAQAEDKDGFQDTKEDSPKGKYGCPDPDNDEDGVLDEDDDCINTPGPARNHGCPEIDDGDRDHDGVLDSKDKCPDVPGLREFQGCPDPDRDRDGVPNAEDKCPDVPGPADNQGCPREPDPNSRVIVGENSLIILDKIQFETGSAKILPASNEILDQVAKTLKDHPEFVLVEVQGHADERGSDTMNLQLTETRSKSVVDALVKRGVESMRLRSQGYGEYCPLDPASSEKAWEANRRVEFKIVKSKDGPTDVVLGCKNAEDHGVKAKP
jgi:OOP family OmpA-OmpF porin